MAVTKELYTICPACGGSLEVGETQSPASPYDPPTFIKRPCTICAARPGYILFGEQVDPDGYFLAWQVLDCVDAAEYAALVDAAKDGLRIILSVGVLFLGAGSKQLTNLRAIFPVGKVTRTALEALVA